MTLVVFRTVRQSENVDRHHMCLFDVQLFVCTLYVQIQDERGLAVCFAVSSFHGELRRHGRGISGCAFFCLSIVDISSTSSGRLAFRRMASTLFAMVGTVTIGEIKTSMTATRPPRSSHARAKARISGGSTYVYLQVVSSLAFVETDFDSGAK